MNDTLDPIFGGLNTVTEPVAVSLDPVIVDPAIEVTRLSIPLLITEFIIAVAIHVVIGVYFGKAKKELEANPDSEEVKQKFKLLNNLFKWYPAGAVVVLILTLYF